MSKNFDERYTVFRKQVLKDRKQLEEETGSKPMRMLDRWKTDGKYYREHTNNKHSH